MVFAARALAARGHHVDVFSRCDAPGVYDEVTWHDIAALDEHARVRDWDVFVSLRFPDLLERDIRAGLRVLWCQDIVGHLPLGPILAWADLLVFVSDWHREHDLTNWPLLRSASAVVPNSIDLSLAPAPSPEAPPLLVHISRPERGLRPLLAAWPSIRARVPGARLAVARYRSFHEPAGSEIEAFCLRMDEAVRGTPGAEPVGHLSKPDLYALLSRAALMVYPAEFDETSCIAAIEAQACGLPVVATRRGALPETLAASACALVDPGERMVERFADCVVELLYDPGARAAMSEAGRRRAADFDAAVIAERWERLFVERLTARAARAQPAILRTLPHGAMSKPPNKRAFPVRRSRGGQDSARRCGARSPIASVVPASSRGSGTHATQPNWSAFSAFGSPPCRRQTWMSLSRTGGYFAQRTDPCTCPGWRASDAGLYTSCRLPREQTFPISRSHRPTRTSRAGSAPTWISRAPLRPSPSGECPRAVGSWPTNPGKRRGDVTSRSASVSWPDPCPRCRRA